MGFGKMNQSDEEQPKKKAKKTEAAPKSGKPESKEKEFVPTSAKELKALVKRAKMKELAKKEPKLPTNDPIRGLKPISVTKPKAFLRVYKEIIDEQIAAVKLIDKKKRKAYDAEPYVPQYEMWEPEKLADSNFVNQVVGSLIFFSWKELRRLCKAGVKLQDYGKDFITTLSLARRAMYEVIGAEVDEKGVRYRLADRDATLEMWPAKPLENREVSKSSVKESNKKAKKKAKVVDEDEEVDELEEVDEAPVKKKGKAGRDGNKMTVDEAPEAKNKGGKPKSKEKREKDAGDIKGTTVIVPANKREGGGPKQKMWKLVAKAGMTVKDLIAKGEAEELDTSKYKTWVGLMVKNGYLRTK